jgi:hypothetical protein
MPKASRVKEGRGERIAGSKTKAKGKGQKSEMQLKSQKLFWF